MAPLAALDSVLEDILDQARWAPSSDNAQPWRFEVRGSRQLVVHGHDTRMHCVYDLDGHASQLSLGALLESMALVASGHGLRMQARRRGGLHDNLPTFDVSLVEAPGLLADPLAAFLRQRSVQRRPLQTRRLRAGEKAALAASLPAGYSVMWLEGWRGRWASACLMFGHGRLRLGMPEAYKAQRRVIEWRARFSAERIPEQALGLGPLTARLMRWCMQSWPRLDFINTWLGGTLLPRLQMDLLPGLYCAAHFALLAHAPPRHADDYVAAGRAMQRFWLTATQLGLQMQPELTPLIFARYVRELRAFSRTEGMLEMAQELARQTQALLGDGICERAVFFGRIGAGAAPQSRSLRRPLQDLLMARADGQGWSACQGYLT